MWKRSITTISVTLAHQIFGKFSGAINMGMLGNQPERTSFLVHYEELDEFLKDATKLAIKHSTSVDLVIAAKKVLEMERRNSILKMAGDYHDEHMGGIGDVLSRIADALEHRVLTDIE